MTGRTRPPDIPAAEFELTRYYDYNDGMNPKMLIGVVSRYASRLRFPQLFLITAALFVLDVLIPDMIPFADEVLLALATILLGSWQKQRSERSTAQGEGSHEA